jgi:hypothetical protein
MFLKKRAFAEAMARQAADYPLRLNSYFESVREPTV